jgi:hypothetical protein
MMSGSLVITSGGPRACIYTFKRLMNSINSPRKKGRERKEIRSHFESSFPLKKTVEIVCCPTKGSEHCWWLGLHVHIQLWIELSMYCIQGTHVVTLVQLRSVWSWSLLLALHCLLSFGLWRWSLLIPADLHLLISSSIHGYTDRS